MAIIAEVETLHGESRELYIRLNNVDASNHGMHAHAVFRGFASEAAFDAGKHFMWEQSIEFQPDVSKPIWSQAYTALKLELDGKDV